MKRVLPLISIFIFLSCNQTSDISGKLDIPNSIFTYTAEGKGIPCIVLSGSENIGHRLFPDKLRNHFILIHADPSNIDENVIKGLTMDNILADFDRVRETLGFDKIAILGHSMFGMIPLDYAVNYPENISYAISTGSSPFITNEFFDAATEYWETEASEERKAILKSNNERLQSSDQSSLTEGRRFINQYMADIPLRFIDPNYDLEGFWEGIDINMDFIDHFWGTLLKDYDNTANYRNIKSPALVISGKYDYGAPYYLWDEVVKSMPDCTHTVLENAGHNPMIEIPDEFTEIVVNWKNKL